MTLDEIRQEIQADMVLDQVALDLESLKIPQLHGKYINFLVDERLSLRKAEADLSVLTRVKWEYYTGKMSQEELTLRGWEPFALKVLRNDLDLYLNSDADMIKCSQKIALQKEKISLLEEVVKELNNRHWKIRNAIEWRKFTNGQ
jgi:hypothetical protein